MTEVRGVIKSRLELLDAGADHFQLLGVAQDASPDQIRVAYFALARQLHPDRLSAVGVEDAARTAQRLFAEVNAAFAVLSDQQRRFDYTNVLKRGGEKAVEAEQAEVEAMAMRVLEAEEAFRRAEMAMRRDQMASAIRELDRAIELNPDEVDYHAALAWARFCTAPDKMAVAAATRSTLEHAILKAPKAVSPRFYLGRIERMLGKDQEGLRHFQAVLKLSPHHTEATSEVRVLEARLASAGADKEKGLFGRPKR
jgi:tetratricopeptide (TPR) repeat protein